MEKQKMRQTTNQIVLRGNTVKTKKTWEIPYRERRVYSNHENNGTWGWFIVGFTTLFFSHSKHCNQPTAEALAEWISR